MIVAKAVVSFGITLRLGSNRITGGSGKFPTIRLTAGNSQEQPSAKTSTKPTAAPWISSSMYAATAWTFSASMASALQIMRSKYDSRMLLTKRSAMAFKLGE